MAKLKPIAATISMLGENQTELATWQTNLVPLHKQDDMVMVAGALLRGDGRAVGRIFGNIPSGVWPDMPASGRPPEAEKHMAVFLAWRLYVLRCKGRKGAAYRKVADEFSYEDPDSVERICKQQAVECGLSWPIVQNSDSVFEITNSPESSGSPDCAALMTNLHWARLESGNGFEVFGVGHAWMEQFKTRVFSGTLRVTVPLTGDDFDFQHWSSCRGPILLASFRPPQK